MPDRGIILVQLQVLFFMPLAVPDILEYSSLEYCEVNRPIAQYRNTTEHGAGGGRRMLTGPRS